MCGGYFGGEGDGEEDWGAVYACCVSVSSAALMGILCAITNVDWHDRALVGNPLGAFLLDRSGGSYRSMIIFSGAVMVVGSTVLILSRWQRSEGRFRVVV